MEEFTVTCHDRVMIVMLSCSLIEMLCLIVVCHFSEADSVKGAGGASEEGDLIPRILDNCNLLSACFIILYHSIITVVCHHCVNFLTLW